MIITNPTKQDVSVIFEGDSYTVKGEGSLEVSIELAEFWTGVHEFLGVSADKPTKKAATKVVKKEEKEDKKK